MQQFQSNGWNSQRVYYVYILVFFSHYYTRLNLLIDLLCFVFEVFVHDFLWKQPFLTERVGLRQ